jgi:glutamate dehydrogenase/leucine dehydrogenase
MATINLALNVRDDDIPRLLAALRAKYGQVLVQEAVFNLVTGDVITPATYRDMTAEELTARLKASIVTELKNMVLVFEKTQARRTAEAAIAPINAV